jgi:CspA family cold shock protein
MVPKGAKAMIGHALFDRLDRALMNSRREMLAQDGAPERGDDPTRDDDEALIKLTGTMKWFDATRGFGFLVSDQAKGDVLVHFSILKEHDRRSLPEGAIVECLVAEQERGLRRRKVLSIDLSPGNQCRSSAPQTADGTDRPRGLIDSPASSSRFRVNRFYRLNGYGFPGPDDNPE